MDFHSVFSDGVRKKIKGLRNLEFISTRGGHLKLILYGYTYLEYKTYNNTVYYRCARRKSTCRARLCLNETKDEIAYKNIEHNHSPDQ